MALFVFLCGVGWGEGGDGDMYVEGEQGEGYDTGRAGATTIIR